MFYILKINALNSEETTTDPGVIIKYNKDPHHGKIHFIALDHKMASNIYKRKSGHPEADRYRIQITCYDGHRNVTYLNTREVCYKPA